MAHSRMRPGLFKWVQPLLLQLQRHHLPGNHRLEQTLLLILWRETLWKTRKVSIIISVKILLITSTNRQCCPLWDCRLYAKLLLYNKNLHLIFVPYIGHWGRGKNLSKVHLERTLEQFPVCCNKMTIKLAFARMPSGLLESRVGRYCRFFGLFVFMFSTQKRLPSLIFISWFFWGRCKWK